MPTQSSPVSANTLHLTPNNFEQLFATIEKSHKYSKKTDAYFSTQFLNRFGFQNPLQVIEFLKSPEGKTTLALISQELIKIEELNQRKAEQYREELLTIQRHLIFLLMGLMAKDNALAKQASEITQQQIEHKLKETKQIEQTKSDQTSLVDILDANIKAYSETLNALDKKLGELEQKLAEIDNHLTIIENEALLMNEKHAHLSAHIEQLNTYLQLPVLHDQPMEEYVAHTNQQIQSLTTQINELNQQNNENSPDTQLEHPARHRKMKMLEHQLAFHHSQLKNPPQCAEHVFERLLEHIRERVNECQHLHENQPSDYLSHELEGLKLQEQGLIHVLQVLRKEKILLNAELEEVNDFNQAHFVVDPNQKHRFQKRENCYALCTEEMDPHNLSEEDWLQAQLNYDKLKHEVRMVPLHHRECMQHDVEKHQERKQHYKNLRKDFIEQIQDVKASKVQVLQALSSNKAQKALLTQTRENTPSGMSPKPDAAQINIEKDTLSPKFCPKPKPTPPLCSYSFMLNNLKRLVPAKAPAPRKKDIYKVTRELESVIPLERQNELHKLIDEVTPGKIMSPDVRRSWLDRAQNLIPDVVTEPQLETTISYKLK
ncbi:LidA [Legionella longbeachae]|uniref:LidA n=1 Tax=Legionella longbeachae TaxID=450 RepID=UPI001404F41C|nr:LidA [Legionella longbeachae]QIN35638.1 LidA [Legionella longbeachae]